MPEEQFLLKIVDKYKELIISDHVLKEIIRVKELIDLQNKKGNKLVFAGNGASASISSHCALDFTKQAKIRAICFNEPSFITALSNDYGYEKWVEEAFGFYSEPGDIAVLISSSGSSMNIVNAARYAKSNGIHLISFSGFDKTNPLNILGDYKFWVDSKAYNIIENIHQIWLLMICDLLIGKTEYSVI